MSKSRSRTKDVPDKKGARKKFGMIRQKVMVNASPSEVYEAYVQPKKHAAFTGTAATGSPKVDGRFTAGDGYIKGKYTRLEPGKRIVHEWATTEWPPGYPASTVELTLTPKRGGTELVMVHSRVPKDQVEYYAEGWKEYYWEPLKKYFEKEK